MAKRTYRTANGKQVDMDTLALKNETVIAVGNMRVNARGDQLGPGGRIVKSREEVMKDHYKVSNSIVPRESAQPRDNNVQPNVQTQPTPQPQPATSVTKDINDDPSGPLDEPASEDEWVEDEDGNFVKPEDLKTKTKGISDALAEKKEVSVPVEKTTKQQVKEKSGVKRI